MRKLIDEAGTVVKEYAYDAFGNEAEEAEDVNPFRYCGEYLDYESGLLYLRARYYDAGVGSFTQEDPYWNVNNMIYGEGNTGVPSIAAIMQSGNLYVYCVNNPIKYKDPLGLDIYYYTNEDLKSYSYRDARELESKYGEPVHVLSVNSKEEFLTEWNMMGSWAGNDVHVSLVVISWHGSADYITPKRNSAKEERIHAYDLMTKNIDNILIVSCNAGHYDHRVSGFSGQMLQMQNVGSVIAVDGTTTASKLPWIGRTTYSVSSDDAFAHLSWTGKKYRDAFGFIKYTLNDGNLECTTLGTKFTGVNAILNAAGI